MREKKGKGVLAGASRWEQGGGDKNFERSAIFYDVFDPTILMVSGHSFFYQKANVNDKFTEGGLKRERKR